MQYQNRRWGHNSTRSSRTYSPLSRPNGRMLQFKERGKGHLSTSPRRIIASTLTSTLENAAVFRESEGSQQYEIPYDHTLHSLGKAGENGITQRAGGGTTIADPVGPYPPPAPPIGRLLQYWERGRGTTVADPVGSYPLRPRQCGRNQQHHVGGRGHNSIRPRQIISSTLTSNRRMLQYFC